jgi:hypothetical protein
MNFITPEEAFGPTYAKYCDEIELAYIKKYWLTDKEYEDTWEKRLDSIFKRPVDYPDNIYRQGVDSFKLVGGILFEKDEFEKLKQLMKYAGDEYFVICEDTDSLFSGPDTPPVRLRFPSDVEWDHINIDDKSVSQMIFQHMVLDVFVFGDSGKWGLYSGGDRDRDYDKGDCGKIYSVWGTKGPCTEVFKELFSEEIVKWNPETWDYTYRPNDFPPHLAQV